METDFYGNICIGSHCNLKCPYCFANPLAPPKKWAPEVESNLKKLELFANRTGCWTLEFSGGEPTIYPGFGEMCGRLMEAGHRVMFYTNGVRPLNEVFPGETARNISRVTFSYHVAHQKSPHLREIFDENIAFLKNQGVHTKINYVLYPDRSEKPAEVREYFEKLGVEFSFRVFQGKHEGKEYPYDYTAEEKSAFADYGEVQSRFLVEHGNYISTFKPCRAGSASFYIDANTGGVCLCEQLQQRQIANIYHDNAAEEFAANVLKQPINCPSKRCLCRYTVEQEEFLQTHDSWDMANYPEWERISLPLDKATAHWEKLDGAFVREVADTLVDGEVYLWGGGVHSIALVRAFQKNGFPLERISGIIDTNPLHHGGHIAGIPIGSRKCLDEHGQPDKCNIVISSRAFEPEIKGQIDEWYGDRFNTVCLYDGSMKHQFESVD